MQADVHCQAGRKAEVHWQAGKLRYIDRQADLQIGKKAGKLTDGR
jgi:hypothetical protein